MHSQTHTERQTDAVLYNAIVHYFYLFAATDAAAVQLEVNVIIKLNHSSIRVQ